MLKNLPNNLKANLVSKTFINTAQLILGLILIMAASSPSSEAHEMHLQLGCLRPASPRLNDPSLVSMEKGLWLATNGDQLQAIVIVDGQQVTVASASDRQLIESKIEDLTAQKLGQLLEQYDVQVLADGQSLFTQEGQQLSMRAPKLAELFSLEFALSHAHPSARPGKRNSPSLRIGFLTQTTGSHLLADWSLDATGKPVITVQPNIGNSVSLESIFLHELGHHSQYRMGLDPSQFGQWKKARQLGWHYFRNPSTGEEGWAILTKARHFFKFAPRLGVWVRCNQNGQVLGTDGARVKRQCEAQQLAALEISQSALIRPSTNYFTSPAEVLAEGMMLYRLNEQSRDYLQSVSPELYELVAMEDQAELDKVYGTGKKLRLPCGAVADSTAISDRSVRLAAEH